MLRCLGWGQGDAFVFSWIMSDGLLKVTVPFPKVNKVREDHQNYRGISVLSIWEKVCDKLIEGVHRILRDKVGDEQGGLLGVEII